MTKRSRGLKRYERLQRLLLQGHEVTYDDEHYTKHNGLKVTAFVQRERRGSGHMNILFRFRFVDDNYRTKGGWLCDVL
jgi:hypothetical protein